METTAEQFDVIVVGFGAAGASAAIEAADAGARVLVLDRGYGGGASALSGGVVYAGGGTKIQQQAGIEDSPENMFAYLRQETGGVVSDETLRRFCEGSRDQVAWLEEQGAEYRGTLAPYKTSYPTDAHYLYYSGNEKAHPYKEAASPAARGHRHVAKGLGSGKAWFAQLRRSALAKGVDFRPLSHVEELVIEDGAVVGVTYRTLPADAAGRAQHKRLTALGGKLGIWAPPIGAKINRRAQNIWERGARDQVARASSVILSAGGFVFNPEWKARYGAPYKDITPLGTSGDDGHGIELGMSAGGSISQMERMTAWRFMSPPSAMIEGVSVGGEGTRILNEDLYGATHSEALIHQHGGRGYLVVDSRIWKKARGQVREQTQAFQAAQLLYVFTLGHKKAATLAQLAKKIGVPAAALQQTVSAYNSGIAAGGDGDPAHKAPELCSPVQEGPFYAIDISIKNSPFYPAPGLTLGGLRVDEQSGNVITDQNMPIPGLYAAGRNAVGICSNSYISGLSLADCVFSGRRAGVHAVSAGQSTPQKA
ncbi:FAD-binding protein [Microbacterium sp. LRZ72]|uniref:FAD-binding protein n=1 Tax=Microbacterium sp. LRZ72 TaxID=2942481 RepID=UPI0029AE13C6|nr:FAD-binding protein [Microbacterium sp. LRZ72]MDX2377849.1 FAD-binding protein [Microbacterium sp. LRZ72]